MGLIQLVDSLTNSSRAATEALGGVGGALSDLQREARGVQAPASFAPLPPPFPAPFGAIAPGGPTQAGTEGARRLGTGGGGSARGQLVTAGSPFVYSLDGGPALTVEALERYATKMELESGGWVYVFAGHVYPGSGGALATMSAGGSGGGTRPGGRNVRGPGSTGNLDRTRAFDRSGSASAGSTFVGDSRPVTDRLDRMNGQLERIGRALEGDGGAGLRFGGGL